MGKGFCLVHAFFQTCAPLFEAVSIRRLGCVAPSALFLVGVGSRKGNGGCRIQFVGYLQTCKFVVFNAHGNLNIGYALRFLCGYAKHFFRRRCGKCQSGLCFFRGKRVLSLQKIALGNFRYVKENFLASSAVRLEVCVLSKYVSPSTGFSFSFLTVVCTVAEPFSAKV